MFYCFVSADLRMERMFHPVQLATNSHRRVIELQVPVLDALNAQQIQRILGLGHFLTNVF